MLFQEENDSLRCQLEAYKNEVDLVRSDLRAEIDQKEKQLKLVQQTLQGMQQVNSVYLSNICVVYSIFYFAILTIGVNCTFCFLQIFFVTYHKCKTFLFLKMFFNIFLNNLLCSKID